MDALNCFHCGLDIPVKDEIIFDGKSFCCNGCKTVYDIFRTNGLSKYYDFEKSPGATPMEIEGKYDFLENPDIVEKLLDFNEENTQIVSLNIPHIHCSSCIWILENLNKIAPGISSSQVNFPAKTVRIVYDSSVTTLKSIVQLLASIGYAPNISLENYSGGQKKADRSLTYKLGVAFFCFGNIMLLSFPEYFEVGEYWLEEYKGFFRWLVFGLSLPSFFYSASGYYVAAWQAIRNKMLNIEIPIALGIVVMFVRSTVDIVFDYGQGFFDSLTGLVFFMLLGKMFQMKTYDFLSFERDYKSYFPVAVTRIAALKEESVPVYEIKKGDRLLIRNQELIPTDGILMSESASIDYSFVTGEAVPITKRSGDKIFAGGRQLGKVIEMQVLKEVSQSYLTQLWSSDVFQKSVDRKHQTITDQISHYFTPALLIIAFAGFGWWIFRSIDTAFNVFTAVLIVACPCALALTAPFTMGNVLRIFGRHKFYLKNALVIEQLAKIDTIVFDKTGTITSSKKSTISWKGKSIRSAEAVMLKNVLRASNHPLSRMLYDELASTERIDIESFEEHTGKGIIANANGRRILIGSSKFVGQPEIENHLQTAVHVSIDGIYFGKYIFHNSYRKGIEDLFSELSQNYQIKILSGDNDGERQTLQKLLPEGIEMVFNQTPKQKLDFIKSLQNDGKNVMMVGDGLNDAGALAQSNAGIAISENVNVFSPACDAILDAGEFKQLEKFIAISKKAITTIKLSFGLSLLYNVVGLSFAVSGNLLPLVAAIIMPLSTVTIISFVTLMSNWNARILNKNVQPVENLNIGQKNYGKTACSAQ